MYKVIPAIFWLSALVLGILIESELKLELCFWLVIVVACLLLRLIRPNLICTLMAFTVLGAVLFKIQDDKHQRWNNQLSSGDLVFEGQLVAISQNDNFLFRLLGKREPEVIVYPSRWTEDREQEAGNTSTVLLSQLNIGDVAQLSGMLIHPRIPSNPGQFNYRGYLLRKGIIGTFYVETVLPISDKTSVINRLEMCLINLIHQFREVIKGRLGLYLSPKSGAVLLGILTGDREFISDETKDAFAKAGVSHILAVSGLHVSLVAGLFLLVCKILRLSPWRSFGVITIMVVFYVIFTGASASSVRAGICFILSLLVQRLGRKTDPLQYWALAGVVLLLFNPLYLWDVGFQLSFAASFTIIYWLNYFSHDLKLKGWKKRLALLLLVNGAAQFGTAGIIAYYFNELSIIGIFLNLVVVSAIGPVITLAVIGVILSFLPLPYTQFTLCISGWLLELLITLIEKASTLSWASWEVATPSLVFLLCWSTLIVGLPLLKAPLERSKKYGKYLCLSSLIVLSILSFRPVYDRWLEKITVTFIDVGQGDAILIRTAFGDCILIDGGGGASSFDVGKSILLPYLKHVGVKRLTLVINTHPHDDHLQGLVTILEKRDVDLVVDNGDVIDSINYNRYKSLLETKAIPYRTAIKGDLIQLSGDIEIEILHPSINWSGGYNDRSMVLRLNTKHGSLLFTGDLEKAGQQELLFGKEKINLKADVIKVPHHGSDKNVVLRFIDAVAPDIAVIQVGSNNFGQPSLETIEAYTNRGASVYRTDQHGAIETIVTRFGIKVNTFR